MKTLQIRIEDTLRSEADSVLASMGLDLPTAVRLYLMKVVQTRSIPFALEAPDLRFESIEVDSRTQKEMDTVMATWKQRRA